MTTQSIDKDKEGDNVVVEREGFTSDELAEQSNAYNDETEIERRMRRGDESKGDPNERDVAGAPRPQNVAPEINSDKKRELDPVD